MPVGVLLTLAISVEVAATIALRSSDGFTRPLPSAIVVVGYATSFYLLSLILKELSVGTTYAIWAGAGTAAIAVIGILALGEPATALKLGSIALIVIGVIGLNLSGTHPLVARPSRRAELLDAAIAVIRRDGARALTLDAVAAEAGASKGGVLYHFASKRALVDGLLERWLDEFEAGFGAGAGSPLAYVRSCDLSAADQRKTASEFGLLAALIEEPQVLEAVRARYAGWMERLLAEVRDPADAWLVRLAADGLWYSDLLGIAAPAGRGPPPPDRAPGGARAGRIRVD